MLVYLQTITSKTRGTFSATTSAYGPKLLTVVSRLTIWRKTRPFGPLNRQVSTRQGRLVCSKYSLAANMDQIFWLRFGNRVLVPAASFSCGYCRREFGVWTVGCVADHRVEWVNCRPLCGRNSRNGRPLYLVMPSPLQMCLEQLTEPEP